MTFGLGPLLGTRPGRFLRDCWPQKLFVSHGPVERIGELRGVRALASARRFRRAWRGEAHAWPPEGADGRVTKIPRGRIRASFDSRCTIYCLEVERQIPAVDGMLRALEADLGLRRGDMTAQAILSKAGSVGRAHFDADCTFHLQLEGEKRWHVAANRSLSHPHRSRMMAEEPLPGMKPYLRRPFPPRMPSRARRFTTRAGSLVFLPHGCWHAATCERDSLSLLFVLTGPKWYELFLREIERALIGLEDARRLSLVGPGRGSRVAAKVLGALRREVARMDAAALVERWSRPPDLAHWVAEATRPSPPSRKRSARRQRA